MIGVDATHAWAAVWLPGGSWLAFDPTNNQLVDERYTTVAWGRDYGDVPPLKGVIFTDAKTSSMKVQVDVAPVGIAETGDAESRPALRRLSSPRRPLPGTGRSQPSWHHLMKDSTHARLRVPELRPATGLRELALPELRLQRRLRPGAEGVRPGRRDGVVQGAGHGPPDVREPAPVGLQLGRRRRRRHRRCACPTGSPGRCRRRTTPRRWPPTPRPSRPSAGWWWSCWSSGCRSSAATRTRRRVSPSTSSPAATRRC